KVGGGVLARFDGVLVEGAIAGGAAGASTLDVEAKGENVATATTDIKNISILGAGSQASALATIASTADVEAKIGSSARIATSGAVTVDARHQGEKNKAKALVQGLTGGGL